MGFISVFFNVVLVDPMINILVMLYILCSENFGLAIIVFTFIVRGALTPLSVRQSKQFKAMGALQPKLKALQEKYKNDRSRISSETMKLYRENGVSPLGCLGPTFLQMPVFFALFWALRGTLPSTPENLTKLSDKLYGKYEAVNPGGSIKDRPVKWILDHSEHNGLIKKGDTIVEATCGNTGISLSMMCAERGYNMTGRDHKIAFDTERGV